MLEKNEIRVDIEKQNNRLYQLIMSRYQSVNEFCKATGLSASEVGRYLNLKKYPQLKKRLVYHKICNMIADHFFVEVEELFPLALYTSKDTQMCIEMQIEHVPFHECMELGVEANQYDVAEANDLRKQVAQVLHLLTPREEQVIRMRFGIDGGGPMTMDEVGAQFNVSGTRIIQIEAKALRKLRHPAYRKKLSVFME